METRRLVKLLVSGVMGLAGAALLVTLVAAVAQRDIVGPPGSGEFGRQVVVLPNGNFVVTDWLYDAPGPITDVGAVYLYAGPSGELISRLTGSQANDRVGSGGVTVLANGNYVVVSPYWDNGSAADAGAATWGSGTTGITGVVTVSNSLVGSQYNDRVANLSVTALTNGDYVVSSPYWDNGSATDAGAATWGSGTTGITGAVTVSNSLVGSQYGDLVGHFDVTVLTNGNYVVRSPYWDNGSTEDAGAATFGDGTTGITGVVTVLNSLVGGQANDYVGSDAVTVLSNGNYVVPSPWWDNGSAANAGAATWGNGTTGITGVVTVSNSLVGGHASDQVGYSIKALTNGNYVVRSPSWNTGIVDVVGAVTWGNGTIGITGVVSASNSLVGSQTGDQVGSVVTALSNGHYVVSSVEWDNGGAADAGAATWGDGTAGITGAVTVSNSLVGSQANDYVGWEVTPLSNGNYVVRSPWWDKDGVADAGAVTWGSGTAGITGAVTGSNSLVGSQANDQVGANVAGLASGNYVVRSPYWDNGVVTDTGAATWGNGVTGITGVVSATNSLVGSQAGDQVGSDVTALSNGNYVVASPHWDNGGTADAGAATWGDGTAGVTGVVSASNSLVASHAGDQVGNSGVCVLANGNYVVRSPYWDNDGVPNVGAVTWGDGTAGITGAVTVSNSLVGSQLDDQVGSSVTALSDGDYVVFSYYWDNGGVPDAGAVTLGQGRVGNTVGPVSLANSVRGAAALGGYDLVYDYDYVHDQLVVGRPAENLVTLIAFYRVYLPLVMRG